jgi:DNA repair exonuclease SbcCD ATPase subunit
MNGYTPTPGALDPHHPATTDHLPPAGTKVTHHAHLRLVEGLEERASTLQAQATQATEQLHSAQERLRALEWRVAQQAAELQETRAALTQQLDDQQARVGSRVSNGEMTPPSPEQQEVVRLTKTLHAQAATHAAQAQEWERASALTQARLASLTTRHAELKATLALEQERGQELQQACQEQGEVWTTLSECQAQLADREAALAEVEWEVERGRERVATLEARLHLLEPSRAGEDVSSAGVGEAATASSTSLFGVSHWAPPS